MPDEPHPTRVYVFTFIATIIILSTTVAVSFIDIGRHWNNAIALILPCIKAVLILSFFMHVRYQPWVVRFFAGAGFLWLAIMLTLTMADYVTRNHPRNDDPKGEPVYVSPAPYSDAAAGR